MKNKTLLTTCLLFLSALAITASFSSVFAASGFCSTYGGPNDEVAYSILQTSDGGYVLAGYTGSFGAGGLDVWLIKVDSSGQMQWNETYGGLNNDTAYSLVQTRDGGLALAGYTQSFGAGGSNFWLIKTNSAGRIAWNQSFGGTGEDIAYSLIQTEDGGFALVGSTNSSDSAGKNDFWLVKTDEAGKMQWNRTFGGAGEEVAKSIIQTNDGGYAISGYKLSPNASAYDAWVIKTDNSGIPRWNQTYGGPRPDGIFSLLPAGNGGFALAGGTVVSNANKSDVWMLTADSSGSMMWNKTYGGILPEAAESLIPTADGGYGIAGITESFGEGSQDCWLIKTDQSGNMLWNQTFGGPQSDAAYSIVQTGDGGYALAGFTESSGAGDRDFFLVKVDGNGVVSEFPPAFTLALFAALTAIAIAAHRRLHRLRR